MASPQVRTVEYDLSKRVPSFNGMVGLAIGNFEKGSTTERMFMSRQDEVDKRLGKPGPASSDAYYILHSFLTKSQRCWVRRVANQAKYAGSIVGSAFHTLLGVGNNISTSFSGTLSFGRCFPSSVSIYVDKDKVGYDTPVVGGFSGTFSGSNIQYNIVEHTSTVNYSSGAINITFTAAPPKGAKIYARWGFPTIDFTEAGVSDEVLLSPSSYEWMNRKLQLDLRATGVTYAGTLPTAALAPSNSDTQDTSKFKIFDNGTLIAWGHSTGLIENATGISFLDSGSENIADYATGSFSFKASSSYHNSGAVTIEYYRERVDNIAHVFKVYDDIFTPRPVLASEAGATQSTSFAKIYDDTTLVAWGNENGIIQNATGITFLKAGEVATVNYTTGVIKFTVDDSYTLLGTITARYFVPMEEIPSYIVKQFADILPPYPVAAPPETVTSADNATVKIYDDTVMVAYADETGILINADGVSFLSDGTYAIDYSTGELSFTIADGYTLVGAVTAQYCSELSDYCVIYADSEGEWGNKVAILINDIDIPNSTFKVVLYEKIHLGGGIYTESMTGEQYILSADEKLDGYGKQLFMEYKVNGKSYFIRTLANPTTLFGSDALANDTLPHNSISYNNNAMQFFTGGDNGYAVSVAEYIKALYTFQNKEDIDINIVIDTLGDKAYQLKIAEFSDRELYAGRGDCYGVLYTPFAVEEPTNYINSLLNYRKYELAFNSSFVGLYTGHLKIYDTYNGRERWIPPSGFVSAAFSYTADQYDAWWPAAGWARGALPVLDVYRRFTLGERDILYDNEVNVMRYRPGKGIAIWGQKTLYSVPSALDRANVRWLLIVMEKGIEGMLEYQEFELNDDYTRNLTRVAIVNYLANIKARRGLYDYDVVCDKTNNTPEEIDNYKMNVDTYVQPVKAIEYIYSRIIITRTGATFSDIRIQ